MGSAIGDYIHYYWWNYKKYGVNRRQDSTSRDYAGTYDFSRQKNIIETKLGYLANFQRGDLDQIQKNVNKIFNKNPKSGSEIQQIQQLIIKKLEEQFGQAINSYNFNWETGDVSSKVINEKTKTLNKIKITDNQNKIKFQTVQRRIAGLETLVGCVSSMEKKKELKAQIEAIKVNWQKIVEQAGYDFYEMGLGTSTNFIPYFGNAEFKSLVEEINKVVSSYKANTSLIKGEFVEYAVTAAQCLGRQMGIEEIEKIITNFKKGNNGVEVKLDESFFPSNVDLKFVVEDSNKNKASVLPSKDKLDVLYQLRDNNTAAISVKNYNFNTKHDVSLVSRSPWLYMIQDESPDFINHYLNLTALHSGITTESRGVNLTSAHEAMKYTLLYKAMTGDSPGRSKAEVLLVNQNNASGLDSIKVYNMSELIYKTMHDTGMFSIDPNINNYHFTNGWSQSGPADRINKLLKQMYNEKISIKMKKAAFY